MQFPNRKVLTELDETGQIDYVLDLLASAMVSMDDRKNAAQLVRSYLELSSSQSIDKLVLEHQGLRKAVYKAIFNEKSATDSSVEVYWDVVSHFGSKNQCACIQYVQAARRSVPLKLGRLLLYKAEFANDQYTDSTGDLENFESTLLIFFSVQQVAETVITPSWLQEVSNLAKSVKGFPSKFARKLLDISEAVKPLSDSRQLVTLFPHITLPQASFLLRELGGNADSASQFILDEPARVTESSENKESPSILRNRVRNEEQKFVVLDDLEKDAHVEALREFNRRNFKYELPDSDDDNDPSEDKRDFDTVGKEELSQADKKSVAQEEQLWNFYQSNPKLFDKSSRKTKERESSRLKSDWTDEQIEGWGRVVGSKGKLRDETLGPHTEVETYAPKLKSQNEDAKKPSDRDQKKEKLRSGKPNDNQQKEKPRDSSRDGSNAKIKPNRNNNKRKPHARGLGKEAQALKD